MVVTVAVVPGDHAVSSRASNTMAFYALSPRFGQTNGCAYPGLYLYAEAIAACR